MNHYKTAESKQATLPFGGRSSQPLPTYALRLTRKGSTRGRKSREVHETLYQQDAEKVILLRLPKNAQMQGSRNPVDKTRPREE